MFLALRRPFFDDFQYFLKIIDVVWCFPRGQNLTGGDFWGRVRCSEWGHLRGCEVEPHSLIDSFVVPQESFPVLGS